MDTTTATAARNAAFAAYRALVDAPKPTTARGRNAHQRNIDAAYQAYTFACGDVERATRTTMRGATEHIIQTASRAA